MNIETVLADYQNKKHASDLIHLLSQYAKDPMGGGEALSSHVTENLLSELIKRPYSFSVLCYVDGVAAGIANCFEGFSTFKCKPLINIHDFAVSSDYRRKGLSQHLLRKIEEIARQKQCCKITMEVLEGNLPAQRVYSRFGFEGYSLDPSAGHAMFWQKEL